MKPKYTIFWKTFFITTAMLMGVTFIAFTLIYMLLPGFYQNHKISTYQQMFRAGEHALSFSESLDDEIHVLYTIFGDSNSSMTLLDEDGHVLYQNEAGVFEHRSSTFFRVLDENDELEYGWLADNVDVLDFDRSNGLTIELTDDGYTVGVDGAEVRYDIQVISFDQMAPMIDFGATAIDFEYTFLNLNFQYAVWLQEPPYGAIHRTLEITIPLSPLADAQVVIMSMYPFAVLLSVGFALIAALIFSRWLANPIKNIQVATSRMSKLEPNVTIETRSQDEIGMLGRDISQLYEQLHGTIVTLEQEVSRYSDAENKKIEFLQSVSHEMKTPLASANALLEGIIYEVSPYHDNPKQYLEECRDFLQKTIQLTKESLNLSEQYKKPAAEENLADLIKETSNLYEVIFMIKQLSYSEDVPGNIAIHIKKHLFAKVLSNLFSNAANYTRIGGYVKVTYKDGVLTIFNSCDPLSKIQVDEIFKPLMTQNTTEHATGLGLFIVKQLLRQLQIDFEFVAVEDGSGMAFKLYLDGA